MVIATALAVYGSNQVSVVRETRMAERPQNIREALQYEAMTGKTYDEDRGFPGSEDNHPLFSEGYN